jgi:hypothetical protein
MSGWGRIGWRRSRAGIVQRRGAARCYTWMVPTTRPRHTITETPPVQEALDELRTKLNGQRIDFAELVILGARAKARRLPDDEELDRKARRELAEMIRTRSVPVDIRAAEEVKHLGLIANYEDE